MLNKIYENEVVSHTYKCLIYLNFDIYFLQKKKFDIYSYQNDITKFKGGVY